MSTSHKFGGTWTVEKLNIFSDYLDFYITALKKQKFKKIYIDAFAGTGRIDLNDGEEQIEGSVRLALNAPNKFDEYIFIENKKKHHDELLSVLDAEYAAFRGRVTVRQEDSNLALKSFCESIDWRYNRALLLLDPYATEVNWSTLELIAQTKAIDLWYLFPLSAVQRMMPRHGDIDPTWRARLTSTFGDSGWEKEFYKEDPQMNLFRQTGTIRDVNTASLADYICNRLRSIFPGVAPNPRILYNSKNSPMFLFCFAVSNDNQRAIDLAMRGANYILNHK